MYVLAIPIRLNLMTHLDVVKANTMSNEDERLTEDEVTAQMT